MNYYSHNIGDYAQATMHLSLIEDAVYNRLLRRYYAEEAPLINDMAQLCRWVGARSDEEKAAVEVVVNEFFVLHDGYWHNKRADREIDAYRIQSERLRALHNRNGYHQHRGEVLRAHRYLCAYCGERHEFMEIDHVIPRSQGGTDDITNLVAACRPCNRSKSGRTPSQWREGR